MGFDKPVQVTVALARTESRLGNATPKDITCVFSYLWDADIQMGRAFISTINDEQFGAVGDDGSGAKNFSGTPLLVTNQLAGGIGFQVAKFALKVSSDVKKAQAAIWVKEKSGTKDIEKLLYKSANYSET